MIKKCLFVVLLSISGHIHADENYYDPFEAVNRPIFQFNQKIDSSILKPIAKVYANEIPSPIRKGVSNFINYLGMPFQISYHLLQGNKEDTGNSIAVFMLNTIGFGVLDIASEAGLSNNKTSLGAVFYRFNVPAGPFVEIPFLGGASLRHSTAKIVANDFTLIESDDFNTFLKVLGIIDWRYQILPYDNILNELSFDKYLLYRNAKLQREIKN